MALARRLLAESTAPAHLAPLDVVEAHLLTLASSQGDDQAARAEALALRAVRTAEEVPLPTTACQGRQVLALLARRHSFDDADVHLRHMFATADTHGLPIWRLRAQIRLATNELMRTGEAEQILLARQAALTLGAVTAGAQADATIAMQQVLYCEFDHAEALADSLLESTTRMHQEGESQFCLVIKIAAQAHQGRREGMRAVLAEFRQRGGEQSFHAPVVFGHRAICALLGEDRPGAEAEMARVREWSARTRRSTTSRAATGWACCWRCWPTGPARSCWPRPGRLMPHSSGGTCSSYWQPRRCCSAGPAAPRRRPPRWPRHGPLPRPSRWLII